MSAIRRAVIVAAGRSSRLYPLTRELPKGLLKVGGEALLERSLRLLRAAGVERVLMVVGHAQEKIREAFGPAVEYRANPFYAQTNNMASLWLAEEWVADKPFLYLHSDILYEAELLESALSESDAEAVLVVDEAGKDAEAMKVRLEDGRFAQASKDIPAQDAAGEWVGIAAFHAPSRLFAAIDGLLKRGAFQAYDAAAMTELAKDGARFSIASAAGSRWIEVDDQADLLRAGRLFA